MDATKRLTRWDRGGTKRVSDRPQKGPQWPLGAPSELLFPGGAGAKDEDPK